MMDGFQSPLSQGRELKCSRLGAVPGRWRSPLSQGRELKYVLQVLVETFLHQSPLSQGRELKLVRHEQKAKESEVAPLAGA